MSEHNGSQSNGGTAAAAPQAARYLIDIVDMAVREERLKAFVRDQMQEGHDYGVIPGTNNKRVLWKPGAEKICAIFGVAPCVEVTQRVENLAGKDGFASYEVKVTLVNKRTLNIEGEGIGSCNSNERRYKNQDAANVANTLLKMAKKRAHVDATLSISCVSGLFEDEEDFDLNERSNERGNTPRTQGQQRPQQQTRQQAPAQRPASRPQSARQSAPQTEPQAAPAAHPPQVDSNGEVRCKCGIIARYMQGKPGKPGGFVCGHGTGGGCCDFRMRDGEAGQPAQQPSAPSPAPILTPTQKLMRQAELYHWGVDGAGAVSFPLIQKALKEQGLSGVIQDANYQQCIDAMHLYHHTLPAPDLPPLPEPNRRAA